MTILPQRQGPADPIGAEPVLHSSDAGQFDAAQALRFLQLLGKDPAGTWFRIIRHKKDGTRHPRGGADLHGLDLETLSRDNANGWSVYYVSGNASTATSVNKRTGKPSGAVWEGDITSCPAVFAEWDDKPIEWQLNAWRELRLPEPTVMVLSGGKSVHCYWVLTTPLPPAQWRALQSRLIDHCGSDKNCKDPCRVMRLPGFQYINKTTNEPTGQTTEIVHESGMIYTTSGLEAALPDPEQQRTQPIRVNNLTTDQWRRVLTELLKQPESLFTNEWQDCPLCGSANDFKGQVLGSGYHMICNNCGGMDGKGGMLTEFGFAERILKVDRATAKDRVARFLGVQFAPPKHSHQPANSTPTRTHGDFPPRSLDEIQAAAAFIPERVVGGNTYDECWHALCGCAAALAAIGLPEEHALDLLAAKWPSRADAQQALTSSTTRNPASFWRIAKDHGFDARRTDLRVVQGGRGSRRTRGTLQRQQGDPTAAQAATPATLPASFEQLIHNLPDGWVQTEEGIRPSKVRVGEMARLIEGKAGELLRFNEMTLYVEAHTTTGWIQVNDARMDTAYVLLDQKGWIINSESVIKAICHVARQHTIHPVRQYLLRILEDPTITPYNLDRVAADLFRSESALHGAMFRKWLIGAAARAMVPGCKMDYCLVLQSAAQGLYKSTALETLASQDWHTSNVPKDDKDFLLNVHSTWIYELAELESVTSKRAAGQMKNIITTRADKFRVPYGRTTETRKRSSVFCGSANTDSFLRDDTGDRRYWVIPIEGTQKLNIQAISEHRDAIWKAALIAHQAGELPMLSAEQEAASEQQNEGFKQQDAWLEMLQAWMGGNPLFSCSASDPTPKAYSDGGTYSPAEILYSAGLKRPDQINNSDATRLGPLLRALGFESRRVVVGNSKVRRWIKDHPGTTRTTRTTPDHLETVSGGPAKPVPPRSVSADGPPGPPEKSNNGRKETEQAGTIPHPAHAQEKAELLKQSGGPSGSTAESASVCNGSGRTTCTSQTGGLSGGPDLSPPVFLPQLRAIRAANPTATPWQLMNLLMGEYGIKATDAQVKAALQQLDASLRRYRQEALPVPGAQPREYGPAH